MDPRRLRAPQRDREVLAEPLLNEAGQVLARNRHHLGRLPGALLGKPWPSLRSEARLAAIRAATRYLVAAGESFPSVNVASLVMAGHQPELFHPGVWVKNFVLNGLARFHQAAPFNLIVDNDIAKAKGVHVPVLTEGLPGGDRLPTVRRSMIPFETGAAEEPFEEHCVGDEKEFAAFPERLLTAIRTWPFRPLAEMFWSEVMQQARRTRLLGERFAAARRALERRWGCHNGELPVSALCGTEPFAWFACHILTELPRFHSIYNSSVRDYRRAHGLRSRNHPFPDLGAGDGWLEAPFWGWRAGQKQRRRLFVRLTERQAELRAGDERWPTLALPSPGDSRPMVGSWLELEKNGFKVRSRALTNTLFCRLFVADLFIHGIGGGKYDEVTDEIARRFYGFEPPEYLVLSATVLLPFGVPDVRREDLLRVAHLTRDLHYNPQRHLVRIAEGDQKRKAEKWATEKRALIAREVADKVGRQSRLRALRAVNERLRSLVESEEPELQRRLEDLRAQLHAHEILGRRDYAFCLFPEDKLRPFCTQFLGDAAYRAVGQP
jgi:hypothetical protein